MSRTVLSEKARALNAERFALWYMLWQIEQESDHWLRFGGDARMTMEYVHDLAESARLALEALPVSPDDSPVYAIRDKETP